MNKQLDTPKQKFHAPTVLAFAAVVFIIATAVAVGFAWGLHTTVPTQGKQAGEVFDRVDYRLAGEPFVKMPDELP